MTQLRTLVDMTRTLLDLAQREDWVEFKTLLLEREKKLAEVFGDLSLDDLEEDAVADVRLLQELNHTLLAMTEPEAKRLQAAMAKLKKDTKANAVYKNMR